MTPERAAVEKWLRQWGIHNDGEILGLLDAMERPATLSGDEALRCVCYDTCPVHGEAVVKASIPRVGRPAPLPCARYWGSDGTLCATHNQRFNSATTMLCDRLLKPLETDR